MSRFLAMLAALGIVSAPAAASDFSFMAKPAFARFLLLPAKRQTQIECAGLAIYLAQNGGKVSKAAAERLGGEVERRLAIDLGEPAFGRKMIASKAAGYGDPTKTEPVWAEARKYMSERCETLFVAAEKGGTALSEALGPMPAAPIDLPTADQCLAVATRASELGRDDARELMDALRKVRLDSATPAERVTRLADVEKGAEMLRRLGVDGETLEMMSMACIPTVRESLKDVPVDVQSEVEH